MTTTDVYGEDQRMKIGTPTLHVHGLRDGAYKSGKKQAREWFEEDMRMVWDVDYHHAMPWHRKDVLRLAELVRGMGEYV